METVLNKKREEEGWGLRSPCICNHCIRIQIWKRTQNRTNVLSIIILFFFEFWPTKITFKFFCLTGYCFHWTINILVWHSNEYTQKRQFYILVETIFFTLLYFFYKLREFEELHPILLAKVHASWPKDEWRIITWSGNKLQNWSMANVTNVSAHSVSQLSNNRSMALSREQVRRIIIGTC